MMTNDELKKKIVKVLQELRASKPIVPNDYGLQIISCTTDREIADALIAAGIGDVKEAEHRAEVAERALRNRARQYVDLQGYTAWEVAILAAEFVVPNDLKQAEKELAKEGK